MSDALRTMRIHLDSIRWCLIMATNESPDRDAGGEGLAASVLAHLENLTPHLDSAGTIRADHLGQCWLPVHIQATGVTATLHECQVDERNKGRRIPLDRLRYWIKKTIGEERSREGLLMPDELQRAQLNTTEDWLEQVQLRADAEGAVDADLLVFIAAQLRIVSDGYNRALRDAAYEPVRN